MGCDHAHRNWLRFSTLWHFVALCGNPCKSFVFMALINLQAGGRRFESCTAHHIFQSLADPLDPIGAFDRAPCLASVWEPLQFGLELHPDKTRRIEFGRFAEQNRERRGESKPETFDFLGFTHICGKNGLGRFMVRWTTIRKCMRAGTRTGKLSVSDSASNSPQTSSLTGTGK